MLDTREEHVQVASLASSRQDRASAFDATESRMRSSQSAKLLMDRILCGSELPSGKTVMTPNDRNRKDRSDENIERELRLKRPFSLGEAVAREGGSGLLGGASPIAHQRQVAGPSPGGVDAMCHHV